MQLLRRSDSNSRPNVRPAAGVRDHRVSKIQSNKGVKNLMDSDVMPTLKRWYYAVDTLELRDKTGRFATSNGNAKAVRALPGVMESTG